MPRSLTRRQLGFAAAGVISLASTVSSAEVNLQTENGMNHPAFTDLDPVQWTKERYTSAPLRLTFKANTKDEAELWQGRLRTKLIELLGGFPPRIPLNSETIAVRELSGYR